jgi:S1-C subfamily serine protease
VAGAVGALTASGIGILSGAWDHRTTVIRPVISASPTATIAAASADLANWARVEDQVAPSVVQIAVRAPGGLQYGSGVLLFDGYAGSAYVVTDRALIASGGSVQITSTSGAQAQAKVIGSDPLSDIAVLAVTDTMPWIYAPIGTVADVREASTVIAMAAPNTGGGTIVTGTVDSTDREVFLADGGDIDHLMAIATPAMSTSGGGAAVVDQSGQVVGLSVKVTPDDSADQSLTFAVPIDEALQVARQFVEGHSVQHPWLGVTQTGDLPTAIAEQEGLNGGASVYAVSTDSPASRLGISPSDIIVSLDGSMIDSSGDLQAVLDRCPIDAAISIEFMHHDRIVSTHVRLTNEPDDS